jgi:outer membrane protein TolC
MSRRAVLLSSLLAAATACTVGPPYTRPPVAVPETWREAPALAAGAPASLERWWMGFEDPMLADLIARAVDGNLDLKIAAARVQEARAARGIAASAARPQVDATGAYGRVSRSEAIPPFKAASGEGTPFGSREQNVFEAGFDASWELDVFGGVRRDVEAAVAQVQAAEETERDVLITLLAEVARNYTELRGAQRRLDLVDQTLQAQQETLELATARFDAGLGSELDVARSRALLEAIGSERPELERIAWRAIYRIGVLLGRTESLAQTLEAPGPAAVPPEVPVTLPSRSSCAPRPAARGARSRCRDRPHRRRPSGSLPPVLDHRQFRSPQRGRGRPGLRIQPVLGDRARRAMADPFGRTDPSQHPGTDRAAGANAPYL